MLICRNADNEIRWKDGERLDHLFEDRCDRLAAEGRSDHTAVIADEGRVTFAELEARANQVARHLIARGIRAGDRVGLLLDKSANTYVALLAVLKANAAYVPVDAAFPDERIAFILEDAGVKAMVSLSAFAKKLDALSVPAICLDTDAAEIEALPSGRLTGDERGAATDQLAYIIYTSGTTGKPKGVAIDHASICNFVRVAGEIYGYRDDDRVYQGMTIAFDFSVEELWVPLIAGAALVPARSGMNLVGNDLAHFLIERHVTALCCVPTLLATIEKEIPELRLLLVSGEACPQNLVVRWHREGRTILNAYGPTEATVTATLTELYPEKPVTIGGPLPTYTIVILDENEAKEIADGGLGEIGIAGVGLAEGYLNRPDLTAAKFVPDFLELPNNPSKRIYRTGDLGRINEAGEVEFLGRIDTQVKVRGYRIELTEIESVLMQIPQIAQAVVHTYEPEPGSVELVAYYSLKAGAEPIAPAELAKVLRAQLPAYMVPAYVEKLDIIPMTSSHKADRKALPPPSGTRLAAGAGTAVKPRNDTEAVLAEALCEVMKLDQVSVEDDFFYDLGGHSLLMARYCSEVRKRIATADVSMRDIYLNPSIAKLAAHLGSLSGETAVSARRKPEHVPTALGYYGCGALQIGFYAAYGLFLSWLLVQGWEWTYAAKGEPLVAYGRISLYALGIFVLLSAIPIAAKWALVGRWKEEAIPVWSLGYFRFWLVKTLIQSAPAVLFIGSPIYNLYLRLLGARIGANAVLLSRFVPVCTDLISIGEETVLRLDTIAVGYKAQANIIHTGRIDIGSRAFIGEGSVLDIDTVVGDGAQLGHASSLQEGQRIPAGRRYHGSPAQETTANYCPVEPRPASRTRLMLYSVYQIVSFFGVAAPLLILLAYELVPDLLAWTSLFAQSPSDPTTALAVLALEMIPAAIVLFALALVIRLAVAIVVPRLLFSFIEPDKTYVLFGVHYHLFRIASRLSNSAAGNIIFGDSVFITRFLSLIGYRLNDIVQTGSNFGLEQRHDQPLLCDIGSGTMVSDGIRMINATVSASSFKLGRVKLGPKNYLGNRIYYPAEGRTGANCLLGTKVLIPVDGPVRENVGLLGSPAFEIPRTVNRDKAITAATEAGSREAQIAAKTAHNIVTMALFLARDCFVTYALLVSALFAMLHYDLHGTLALFAFALFSATVAATVFALAERASLRFGRLTPKLVSMYDPYFWSHERYWKLSGHPLMLLFKGTPMKNAVSRLLGVRLGRFVFDDGCRFYDNSLITVGDYTTLSEAAVLQGHSLEEGVFKSDYVNVGAYCTLGAAAFVHYGVRIGDHVVIEPDSFLMKGESPDAGSTWRGNPARAVRVDTVGTATGQQAAQASPRMIEVALPAVAKV